MKLFRRRPRPAEVVAEAQLDYRDAQIEGLRDALAEARREHADDKARLERENAALKAQLAVALLPQWMAAGLRARRRLTTDHTAVAAKRTYKPAAPQLDPAPEPTTRVAPVEHVGATEAGLNVPADVSAEQARADQVIALDKAFAELLESLRPRTDEHERLAGIEAWFVGEVAVLFGCAMYWLDIAPTAELDVLGLGATGELPLVELEEASR